MQMNSRRVDGILFERLIFVGYSTQQGIRDYRTFSARDAKTTEYAK